MIPFIVIVALAVLVPLVQKLWSDGRDEALVPRLARLRRVRIGDVQGGIVRVVGEVRAAGRTLRAPISDRACVAFRLVIERNWNAENWHPILELDELCPFVVADETGDMTVDTSGPIATALAPDRSGPPDGALNTEERAELDRVKRLLASRGVPNKTLRRAPQSLRFVEAILAEGETVAIGGRATREVSPAGSRSSPRAAPERVVMSGTRETPLLISDAFAAIEGDLDASAASNGDHDAFPGLDIPHGDS